MDLQFAALFCKSKIQNRLGGFDDLAGFKAARADADALSPTADKGANGLQVRVKAAVGPIVGVAHAMTKLRPLAANIASFRHCYIPPTRILL